MPTLGTARPRTEAEWRHRFAQYQCGSMAPRREVINTIVDRLRRRFPDLQVPALTYGLVARTMRNAGITVFHQPYYTPGVATGFYLRIHGKPCDVFSVTVAAELRRPEDRLAVLAHEWAHLILHLSPLEQDAEDASDALTARDEAEANLFAADLLRVSLDEIHQRLARAVVEVDELHDTWPNRRAAYRRRRRPSRRDGAPKRGSMLRTAARP